MRGAQKAAGDAEARLARLLATLAAKDRPVVPGAAVRRLLGDVRR